MLNNLKRNSIIIVIFFMLMASFCGFIGNKDLNYLTHNEIETSCLNSGSYSILTEEEENKITMNEYWNQNLTDQIINSFSNGEILCNYWESNIESTFQGLSIYSAIGQLSMLNTQDIANYILSCYNEIDHCFYDQYTGLINASTEEMKIGSTALETTVFAILSLDLLGELDKLTSGEKEFIFSIIISAIDDEKGGFCYRSDIDDVSGAEGSSIKLSYYCYKALDILNPGKLNLYQRNCIADFVMSQQASNQSIHKGSFKDNNLSVKYTIESTYYAVLLLDELNKLDIIDIDDLIFYLELLNCSDCGGTYNEWRFDQQDCPKFYSSAQTLSIKTILELDVDIDEEKTINYIMNGFNDTLKYWPIFGSKDVFIYQSIPYYPLYNQYYIVSALINAGRSLNTSLSNDLVLGLSDFQKNERCEDYIFSVFMPVSKIHGSITKIYEKLNFLKKNGKIEELSLSNIQSIYDYVLSCIQSNKSNSAWHFTEYPGYSVEDPAHINYYFNPIELSIISLNESSLSNYGSGIHQTYAALRIIEILNLFQNITMDLDLSVFADEIIRCQALNNEFFEGSFYYNSKYSYSQNIGPKSILTTFYAVSCLESLDINTDSRFLNDIDVLRLKNYLNNLMIESENDIYFTDELWYEKYSSYNCKITNYVINLEKIYGFGVINIENEVKLESWIINNPNYPNSDSNYEYIGAIYTVLSAEVLDLNSENPLFLEKMREIYSNFLGINIYGDAINTLQNCEIHALSDLKSEIFSTLSFTNQLNYNIGFAGSFEVRIVGISDINYPENQIMMEYYQTSEVNPEQNLMKYSESEDFYYFNFDLPLNESFYPHFCFNLDVDSPSFEVRHYEYLIDCHINTKINLENIVGVMQSEENAEISYKFGLFFDSDEINSDYRPLEDYNLNVTIFNPSGEIIGIYGENDYISISNEEILLGINWVTLNINTSFVSSDFSVEILISSYYLDNVDFILNQSSTFDYETYKIDGTTYCEINLSVDIDSFEKKPGSNSDDPSNMNIALIVIFIAGGVVSLTTCVYKLTVKMKESRNPSFDKIDKSEVSNFNKPEKKISKKNDAIYNELNSNIQSDLKNIVQSNETPQISVNDSLNSKNSSVDRLSRKSNHKYDVEEEETLEVPNDSFERPIKVDFDHNSPEESSINQFLNAPYNSNSLLNESVEEFEISSSSLDSKEICYDTSADHNREDGSVACCKFSVGEFSRKERFE